MNKFTLLSVGLIIATTLTGCLGQDGTVNTSIGRLDVISGTTESNNTSDASLDDAFDYQRMISAVATDVAKWREVNPAIQLTPERLNELTNKYALERFGLTSEQLSEAYKESLIVSINKPGA